MFNIKWAPLNVPLKRRLQTLAICAIAMCGVVLPGLGCLPLILLLYSPLWGPATLYLVFLLNDGFCASHGGRRWEWFRSMSIWRYAADYLPIKLVKTVELDPTKNYMAMTYPHGQLMACQLLTFETNALDFQTVFSGLTSYLIHVSGRFAVPFLREIALWAGGCAADEDSILYLLDKTKKKGSFVILNSGGSAEVMENRVDRYTIVIKNRKGFARVALKAGASIVPVFCFGENKLYKAPLPRPPGSLIRTVQDKIRVATGIAPVPPAGRGLFQYSFGILPHRVPCTVVVGAPFDVPHIPQPTQADIDAVHAQTIQAVVDLFEAHKHKYEPDPNIELHVK